jgi:hypothetical protein
MYDLWLGPRPYRRHYLHTDIMVQAVLKGSQGSDGVQWVVFSC